MSAAGDKKRPIQVRSYRIGGIDPAGGGSLEKAWADDPAKLPFLGLPRPRYEMHVSVGKNT